MQRSLAARIVQGSRKSQRSEIFGKRRSGGARGRRPAGAARGSSRPRRRGPRRSWNDRCSLQLIFRGVAQFGSALGSGPRGRGFKSRHLDHEKAKGFLPFAFLFLRTRTHDLFPFTGLPEIAAKRDFREEEERSAHAGAALPGRREEAADRDDEGLNPRHLDHKKAKGLPFAFLYNERPCRRQGHNETKVKKPLTFSVAALPKRRGQERQREYRGRDLSAYR